MDTTQKKTEVVTDVLQSDHHVHMTDEEIAKARAHHNKRHSGEHQKDATAKGGQSKKNVPVKPR